MSHDVRVPPDGIGDHRTYSAMLTKQGPPGTTPPGRPPLKNVVASRIRKDESVRDKYFDGNLCILLLNKLGVNLGTELIGIQPRMERGDVIVEIWLKNHVPPEKFASDVEFNLCQGFDVISTHPTMSREVPFIVSGLPLDVTDDDVRDYVALFGGKMSTQAPYRRSQWDLSTSLRRLKQRLPIKAIPPHADGVTSPPRNALEGAWPPNVGRRVASRSRSPTTWSTFTLSCRASPPSSLK